MKSTAIFNGEFLGAVAVSSAWGPQTPDPLVSDEIWRMVERLLHDSEGVHFNLRTDDVMKRMSIVRDDEGGLHLVTRVVGYPTDTTAYRLAMLEVRQLVNSALAASIRNPARDGHGGKASNVLVEFVALDRRCFQILLYEAIRVGKRERDARRETHTEFPSPRLDFGQRPSPHEATLTAVS